MHMHFKKLLLAACFGATATTALAQDIMVEGRKLFTQTAVPACAVCHTLQHAGASGEVGPVLDELKPNASRVEKAIRNGIGQMPVIANLNEAQIKLLAQYVAAASAAGK